MMMFGTMLRLKLAQQDETILDDPIERTVKVRGMQDLAKAAQRKKISDLKQTKGSDMKTCRSGFARGSPSTLSQVSPGPYPALRSGSSACAFTLRCTSPLHFIK